MPSITKAEYEGLKRRISQLEDLFQTEHVIAEYLLKSLNEQREETAKWKRYYDAVRETFKAEETVEIPGCFNPADTIEYIVKKQTEVNDAIDHYARQMP